MPASSKKIRKQSKRSKVGVQKSEVSKKSRTDTANPSTPEIVHMDTASNDDETKENIPKCSDSNDIVVILKESSVMLKKIEFSSESETVNYSDFVNSGQTEDKNGDVMDQSGDVMDQTGDAESTNNSGVGEAAEEKSKPDDTIVTESKLENLELKEVEVAVKENCQELQIAGASEECHQEQIRVDGGAKLNSQEGNPDTFPDDDLFNMTASQLVQLDEACSDIKNLVDPDDDVTAIGEEYFKSQVINLLNGMKQQVSELRNVIKEHKLSKDDKIKCHPKQV
ncbi:Uncharacterised protein g9807 [Pycnogonum litorale]